MRLNVFLQKAGVGSRREAERMVAQGRVTINGRVAQPTDPVEENDRIALDGQTLNIETRPIPRLFCLNKPLDVLCTTYDSQGRPTIFELPVMRHPRLPRLMNVGRLDVNSEGLLMMSSDGKLAQAMMHPSTALERTYRVRVHGRLTQEHIAALARGVTVDGVSYRGVRVYEEKEPSGKNTWYKVILTEGKNREIRRLMEHFGCVVNRLIRQQYGPFKLGELPRGSMLEIPQADVAAFMDMLRQKGADV